MVCNALCTVNTVKGLLGLHVRVLYCSPVTDVRGVSREKPLRVTAQMRDSHGTELALVSWKEKSSVGTVVASQPASWEKSLV